MFRYCLGGLTLQSSIRFTELAEARSDKADLVLRSGRQEDASGNLAIHRVLLPDGEPWLSVERSGTGYRISLPDIADFDISSDLKHVAFSAPPRVPLATVRHAFLDQLFPMLMSGWGKLVLHASAVQFGGAAVAFTGTSGMGKSTLAAAFAKRGYRVVTDDALILQRCSGSFTVQATYPSLRLWPSTLDALFGAAASTSEVAHYSRKRRIHFRDSGETPSLPLRALYVLGACGGEVSVSLLSPAEALMEMIRSTFRLDITNRDRLAEELATYGAIARGHLVRRLVYPRDLRRLMDVTQAVLADFENS